MRPWNLVPGAWNFRLGRQAVKPLVSPNPVATVAPRSLLSVFFIRMNLGDLLSLEQIIPEMKASERWSAIVELVDLLVSLQHVAAEDRDQVLAALRQREETMSTGIGFGIAIPHASSDRVGKVVAAFGRSGTGIEFDSLDNAPVSFIVLFVVPKDQFQTHLRTLAAIAKFLNDRTVRDRLGTAKSAAELLDIFKNPPPKA